LIQRVLNSFVVGLVIMGCTATMHSAKVVRNDIEMLYGPVSLKQVYGDDPEWQENAKNYHPDPEIIKKIKLIPGQFQVKIFMATWCSDSRREVPRFMKIVEQAELENRMDINIWAVDRKLKLDSGLAGRYQIKRVATFIFYRNGLELGRIIESPNALTLEADVLRILQKPASAGTM